MSVWVTGTSRGVGRALAQALAQRGEQLVLLGRPSSEQDQTIELVGEHLQRFVACDLARPRELVDIVGAAVEKLGPPEVLIHNAGLIERSRVADTSWESWQRQLDVNLSAPFLLTRAVLPSMLNAGRGRILFVSSISAVVGTSGQAAYHAAKAGLLGLMRCLAQELSDTGLMTAALLPGSVDTRMLAGSGFAPRMAPADVAASLIHYAFEAPAAHNGAVIEMYGV